MKTEDLRDQAAVAILAALVKACAPREGRLALDADALARLAYSMADALLRARDGGR